MGLVLFVLLLVLQSFSYFVNIPWSWVILRHRTLPWNHSFLFSHPRPQRFCSMHEWMLSACILWGHASHVPLARCGNPTALLASYRLTQTQPPELQYAGLQSLLQCLLLFPHRLGQVLHWRHGAVWSWPGVRQTPNDVLVAVGGKGSNHA